MHLKLTVFDQQLNGPSMFAVKAKIYENFIISPALSLLMKHLLIGQRVKVHGTSMFAVKAKIYGVLYNQSSSIAFDETSTYWSAPKSSIFSAFHWSSHGNLVSIGQHFVTTKVGPLPKRTETSLTRTVRESDFSPAALL